MRQITSQPVKIVHHSRPAVFHLCNPTFVKNATLDACSAHVGSSAHATSHHDMRDASQLNKELDTRNVQVTWKLGEFQGERFETSTDSKMEALSLTFWALVAWITHVYDESERFKSKVTKSRKTNLIWIEFRRRSDQAGVDRRKSHNCWNSIAVKNPCNASEVLKDVETRAERSQCLVLVLLSCELTNLGLVQVGEKPQCWHKHN